MTNNKILFFGYGGTSDSRLISAILGIEESELIGIPAILEGYVLAVQRLDQVIDEVLPNAPIQISAQDLLRKSWQEDFFSYVILPSEGNRVSGTIWEMSQSELERMRDWELVEFGWYEDCKGFADTQDGKKVPVVSLQLRSGQSVDHEVNGLNYKIWTQDPKQYIAIAKKAHKLYDENLKK